MKKDLFHKKIIASMLRNFKTNSIFVRMLAITIGVFVVLCLINYIGITVLKQQALNNERSNSEFYVDYSYSYMNKLIQKLDEYMQAMEYDRNVIFLRSLPKKSNYAQNHMEVTDVFNKLSIFKGLIDEIANVYIYMPNVDRIMTSRGVYTPETFFIYNYTGDFDQWKKILTQKYSFTFNIWDFDTSPGTLSQLNLVKSFYEGQSAKSVIVANLNRDLVKVLFKDNEYASSRNIYITNENLQIYSCNTSEEIGKTLDLGHETLGNAEQGSYYNSEYLVSYRFLPEKKIYFIVMTPKHIILKNVSNLTFASYIFLSIMLVAGLALSIFLSQQFCLPIGEMLKDMERFATASRGLPERQNEYEYIKKNINIIYTNNKKLESIIHESMPFVVDIIVMKLLLGGQEVETAAMLARQYSIDFKKGHYAVSIMKSAQSYSNMSEKALADLIALIKKGFTSDFFSVLKFKEDEIVIVCFYHSIGCEQAIDRLKQLSARLEEEHEDESYYFGLGGGVESIYSIHESYHTAQKALDNRRVQSGDKVSADCVCPGGHRENKMHIPADFEQRYQNAIHAGNLDMSEDMIYEILDSNYSKNITFGSYHRLSMWVLGMMDRIIDSFYEDMTKKVSKELLEDVAMAGDILELNDRLLRNNKLLCTAFLHEKKPDSGLKSIFHYIDSNFNKSINLDAVANNFGYNASYLSRLFKHVKGVSFSAYLGKKRIAHARKLLANHNKTIKEIAEESGYNSTGIFIKAFEKAEGVTPGEFRKRNSITSTHTI